MSFSKSFKFKIILFITIYSLIFLCTKKTPHSDFIKKLDQYIEDYQYINVITEVADTLKQNPNIEYQDMQKIYLRYAIAVSMRNFGSISYTIDDKLDSLDMDSLYQLENKKLKNECFKLIEKSREQIQNDNINKAFQTINQAVQIFPTYEPATLLLDSLDTIIKRKNNGTTTN